MSIISISQIKDNPLKQKSEISPLDVKLFLLFFYECTGAFRHICQLLFWLERKRREGKLKGGEIAKRKNWFAEKIKGCKRTVQRFNAHARGLIDIYRRTEPSGQIENGYKISASFYEALRFIRNQTNGELRFLTAQDLLNLYERKLKALKYGKFLRPNVHNVSPLFTSTKSSLVPNKRNQVKKRRVYLKSDPEKPPDPGDYLGKILQNLKSSFELKHQGNPEPSKPTHPGLHNVRISEEDKKAVTQQAFKYNISECAMSQIVKYCYNFQQKRKIENPTGFLIKMIKDYHLNQEIFRVKKEKQI